jgi:hypothetical protein
MQFTLLARKKFQRTVFYKSFFFLFVTTSIAAFLLFFGVDLLLGEMPYYSPVFCFDGYNGAYLVEIKDYPFPFLLSISFMLSLSGSFWIAFIASRARRFHFIQIFIVPWVALILTSPVWGLIWSTIHYQPKVFSDIPTMLFYYKFDTMTGLHLGWISAIVSFPINVLSYIVVYVLILIGKGFFLHQSKHR